MWKISRLAQGLLVEKLINLLQYLCEIKIELNLKFITKMCKMLINIKKTR